MKDKIEKNIKDLQNLIFKIIRITAGILLILLGLAGLFLPILPGIVLILVGVVILNNPALKRMIDKILKKVKRSINKA
jgi:uncharacterized protein YqgC (DUF456 family)